MADKVFSFPGSDSEALALLYIQNLDLSGLSPEEIYDKYYEARERIRKRKSEKASSWPL